MKQMIHDAIAAHLAWTEAFEQGIKEKKLSESLKYCGYDDMCTFGKWLYSLDDSVKNGPQYRAVKDLHYRFHAEAASIVHLMTNAKFKEAGKSLTGDYAKTSAQLVQALHDWQSVVPGAIQTDEVS